MKSCYILLILAEYIYFTFSISVVDLFCFNGEPISLFRLTYLSSVVDTFIIIEANMTHSGNPKAFFYLDYYYSFLEPLRSKGKLISSKISFPKHISNPWQREKYQRNYGTNIALAHMKGEPFIMIVGDADEIPRQDLVSNFSSNYKSFDKPKFLSLVFLYYSFKWRASGPWSASYVINDIGLNSSLADFDKIRVKKWKGTDEIVPNAGWHCSYCMNTTDIARKVKSFAHTEHSRLSDEKWIDHCRAKGTDIFNRSRMSIKPYDGSAGYPVCESCKTLPYYEIFQIPT